MLYSCAFRRRKRSSNLATFHRKIFVSLKCEKILQLGSKSRIHSSTDLKHTTTNQQWPPPPLPLLKTTSTKLPLPPSRDLLTRSSSRRSETLSSTIPTPS